MDIDGLGSLICLAPVVLMAGLGVLVVLINLWEKHPVRPFDPSAPGDEPPATEYTDRTGDAAEDAGYEYAGATADNCGRLYGLGFDFWRSADRTVFVVVASGKMAKFTFNGTFLYSPLPDGRYLVTTDNVAGADLSGLTDCERRPGMGFDRLLKLHLKRQRQSCGDDPPRFRTDHPGAAFVAMREEEAERVVARGLASYTDADRTAYRYNLRGAVWFYLRVTWLDPLGRLGRTLGFRRD